jgi:hypothetical protein
VPTPPILNEERAPKLIRAASDGDEDDDDPYVDMPSCEDCGLVFGTIYDLQRHVNLVGKRDDDTDGETVKKRKDVDDRNADKRCEHRVYCTPADMARKENGSLFETKMKRYVEEKRINEDDSEAKAESKLRESDLSICMHKYCTLIGYFINLQYGPTHKKIMDAVYDYMDDGHGRTKPIRMAVKANKHVLEEFLDSDEESDAPEEKESDEDEGTD